MRLSPEDVAREVRNIEQRPWPYDPMLQMRNYRERHTDGFPKLGTIFKVDGQPVPRVVVAGITALTRNPVGVHEVKDYSSLQEMVEAGWIVD